MIRLDVDEATGRVDMDTTDDIRVVTWDYRDIGRVARQFLARDPQGALGRLMLRYRGTERAYDAHDARALDILVEGGGSLDADLPA